MLARAALRPAARSLTRRPVLARGLHVENTVYNNTPFDYRNKRTFAVKLVVFLSTGFSIPFLASYYQLRKAGGGAAA